MLEPLVEVCTEHPEVRRESILRAVRITETYLKSRIVDVVRHTREVNAAALYIGNNWRFSGDVLTIATEPKRKVLAQYFGIKDNTLGYYAKKIKKYVGREELKNILSSINQ